MTEPQPIDAGHVIEALREQLNDTAWKLALARAEIRQLHADLEAGPVSPPAGSDD